MTTTTMVRTNMMMMTTTKGEKTRHIDDPLEKVMIMTHWGK
jgi:hypothetical protein